MAQSQYQVVGPEGRSLDEEKARDLLPGGFLGDSSEDSGQDHAVRGGTERATPKVPPLTLRAISPSVLTVHYTNHQV